jgi:hypothetical protein
MKPQKVVVNDLMQKNYFYYLTEPMGKNFDRNFLPQVTPHQMLEMGVFGGKYMTDCRDEFPAEWFVRAKLCHERHAPGLNYFGVNASQPLSFWRKKVGSTRKTPEDGFSGIAGIIGAEGARTTNAKLTDGGR